MKLVEHRIIAASPSRVYALLTDATLLMEWMAPFADADPRPGGAVTWTHVNGDSVIGTFVELVPARRVVFTYGWDREDVCIPPGSTTVQIDLYPHEEGTELIFSIAASQDRWRTPIAADGRTTSLAWPRVPKAAIQVPTRSRPNACRRPAISLPDE